MKEIMIKARIDDEGKIISLLKHRGFKEEDNETILILVGIIESLKNQLLNRMNGVNETNG